MVKRISYTCHTKCDQSPATIEGAKKPVSRHIKPDRKSSQERVFHPGQLTNREEPHPGEPRIKGKKHTGELHLLWLMVTRGDPAASTHSWKTPRNGSPRLPANQNWTVCRRPNEGAEAPRRREKQDIARVLLPEPECLISPEGGVAAARRWRLAQGGSGRLVRSVIQDGDGDLLFCPLVLSIQNAAPK
jgi:hypothetical protein